MSNARPPDGAPGTLAPGAPRPSDDGAGGGIGSRVSVESPSHSRGPRVASGNVNAATETSGSAGGQATESVELGGVTVATTGDAQAFDDGAGRLTVPRPTTGRRWLAS